MDSAVRIIGKGSAAKALLRLIEMCATSAATVLVSGESGTGKELVAQALHRQSQRAKGPFVPLNCAAIPRDLLESELFGYRKGAFSGAITDRVGRFELANGGTLFLDEIGDMSLDMQSKLLRVLQERVVDPIGSSQQVRVDVRVIAATHRDLEQECAEGRFREDLFYRLNVLPITVPALRDRIEDIPDLIAHFAGQHALTGAKAVSFDAEFRTVLQHYSWPGNIRELSNLVHRLAVLFPGERLSCRSIPLQMLPKKMHALLPANTAPAAIELADENTMRPTRAGVVGPTLVTEDGGYSEILSSYPVVAANSVEEIIMIANGRRDFPDEGVFLKAQLADFEKKLIAHALNHAGGNISRTAQLLNLQRTTLIQKLNKLKGDDSDDMDSPPHSAAANG